jgi:Protein of unknown function (DUF559)
MREAADRRTLFARVVAVAEGRFGIVEYRRLLDLGATRSWVGRQAVAGRLHRMHQGVYSVLPPSLLRVEGRWLAAVLSCGPGAVLSHVHALALWDLRRVAATARIHVTVPTYAGRPQRAGIRIHRSMTLTPEVVTIENGIPVTTVRRTIADVRRKVAPHVMRDVIRRAQIRQLDVGPIPGDLPPPVDRSELARRFVAVTRRHGLPDPLPEQVIGPYTVDFLWPKRRLVVEVDGWETHGNRIAFEDDRARDVWLTTQGFRVVRFTWRQITKEGPSVARTLRRLLA